MIGPPSKQYRQTIDFAIDEARDAHDKREELLAHMRTVKERFPDAKRTTDPVAFTSETATLEECNELVFFDDANTIVPCIKMGRCRVYLPKGEHDYVSAHVKHVIQFPNVVEAIKVLLNGTK